jgi:hypothetical protein
MLFSAIDFCSGEEENKLVFLNEVNKQKLTITKTKELLIEEINNPVCFKKVNFLLGSFTNFQHFV